MEIKKLQAFLAVYDHLNMSEAADAVFTTQSNISKQISCLEKRLGVTLFDRTKRSIVPTQAAVLLESYARETVHKYAELQNRIKLLSAKETRELCVAYIPVMTYYGLAAEWALFKQTHPDIHCTVIETNPLEIKEALIQKEVHVAFMRKSSVDLHLCEALTVREDRLAVALHCNHPLAQKKILSLAQLSEERILIYDEYGQFNEYCLPRFELDKFEPNVIYHGNEVVMLMDFVESGLGVSLIMEKIARYAKKPNVKIIPLLEDYSDPVVLSRLKNVPHGYACNLLWEFVSRRDSV